MARNGKHPTFPLNVFLFETDYLSVHPQEEIGSSHKSLTDSKLLVVSVQLVWLHKQQMTND